jgi:phenylalanyl-tRNA synthetase beta subunit
MAAQGYTEVSNYSFISEEEARRFGFAVEDHVRVLNPIAAGQELMRTSLLPGIHRNIVENAKHFDEFRIFEIGRRDPQAEYVREFQGSPLAEGRKSVTFRIVAGAPDRTLSSPEITALYDRIVAGLTGLGYEFRS